MTTKPPELELILYPALSKRTNREAVEEIKNHEKKTVLDLIDKLVLRTRVGLTIPSARPRVMWPLHVTRMP